MKEEWKQTSINGDYFLSTEKDLEVNQVKANGKELTLVGYLINPYEPNKKNIDCLKAIFNNVNTTNDIFEELYTYGGRFILIGSIDGEMVIVSDPCGLRQVYYTEIDGNLWFASQPNLLADIFNIPKRNEDSLNDFLSSPAYEYQQRFWVGDDCIYENIYHLMPNYSFNVKQKKAERYWVNHEKGIDLQDAVVKAAKILKGSMNAIAERGNLIQGLTAGWDSRILLAASKDVKDEILFYISLGDDKLNRNTDLKIAAKLADELDLKLHIMSNLNDVSEEVATLIKRNVTQGRNIKKTRTIQYFYDNFQDKININGNISEIARNYFGINHPKITSDYLLKLVHYENIPFAEKNIKKWLENVPDYVLEDIEIPDLLYWEQKMGNWCAMQKAEQDLALEDFSPFNNRELLMTLYNVDKKYREPGNYILYKKIMEELWKDTLSQPINPLGVKGRVINAVKVLISDDMKRKIKKIIR